MIMEEVRCGRRSDYVFRSDDALLNEKRLCVPHIKALKDNIWEETHSSAYMMHPRSIKVFKTLKSYYWWPNMRREGVIRFERKEKLSPGYIGPYEILARTVDSCFPAASGKHAPNISTTPLSDMDSDDLDDVPLARLLKKTNVPEVTVEIPTGPFVFVHSQESSSTEGVFVPTLGIPSASNVQPGTSVRSPPSVSLRFALDDAHAFVPDNVPSDVSTAPEGQTDVQSDENEVDPPNPDVCAEEIPTNADDTLAVPPSSFEVSENVQRWKFVVQWRLAVDLIRKFIVNFPSSPDYQTVHVRGFKFVISHTMINGFLGNVVDIDCSPTSPSTDVLASVLSGGTLSTWPVNRISAVALSIKYAILYKIGIANWFPSSHASSVFAAFETFFGSHVPDIDHDVHPSRGSRIFDTSDSDEPTEGFFVDKELASCIVNSLTTESRALSTSINLLSERRLEVDALIRHLKSFGPIYQSKGSWVKMMAMRSLSDVDNIGFTGLPKFHVLFSFAVPEAVTKEANNITTMRLDELNRSLQIIKLSFDDNAPKKKSGIVFQGVSDVAAKSNQKQPKDENLAETIALLERRFSKFKSKFYKKYRGFGHYQAECTTYLKRKKKGFIVNVSDKETSSDNDCENFGRALISFFLEIAKEDLHVASKKKEVKSTPSDFEEVLPMWEENREVLK
ncbi:envelope-like protein [Cucumis melo var. makuwa]|uniref:Envelope-like protein n=1 Tax=Cucumis melo var. makuwa TaxID=1194695 RepID=A0A5D3CQN6_CUCMM|nr:envelope-like protein [Cucumis melo var. makuwa]